MGDESEAEQQPGEPRAARDQPAAEQAGPAYPQPQEQQHRRGAHREEHQLLGQLRHLVFVIALQQVLDHVGLVFHAEHFHALAGGGEIIVRERRGVRADQHDLARPRGSGDLAHDQAVKGEPVVEIPGRAGEGNVEMSAGVDGGEKELLPVLFQEGPGCLGRHGKDLSAIRLFYRQQGVAQHAVLIGHGVDVPLHGRVPQSVVGLHVADDGGAPADGAAVFPLDHVAVFRHGGGDHTAQLFRGLGQLFIRLGAAFPFVEHVDGHGCGQLFRIGRQLFQGEGHHAPVIGAVGAQLGKSFLVDADEHDVPGGHAPLLEQPVLGPFVHAVQHARGGQRRDGGCCQQRDQVFSNDIHADVSRSVSEVYVPKNTVSVPISPSTTS